MTPLRSSLAVALAVALSVASTAWSQQTPAASPARLATATVGSVAAGARYLADGQVEAARETPITSQVSGQVLVRTVREGDRVRAGQVLVRIDPRAAQQNQAAITAQLAGARAQLVAADRNLERSRELVAQKFLSPATLDRAEAEQRAAAETVKALAAQAAGAATQTGWHTIVAPFDAVVTSVSTEVGDTALPGKPLMQLHDPSALRVAVNVPAAIAARIDAQGQPAIEIPDAAPASRQPAAGALVVVPAADPLSHTQLVRIDLPRRIAGLHPGLFARVWLPVAREAGAEAARLTVPRSALVTRGDLRAVYTVGDAGVALRQVRVGRSQGDEVEILSGLAAGEKVALDPVAAARAAGALGR